MNVWTDAADLTVLPFLQSGEGESLSPWSEPGETALAPNVWTCVVFDVDTGFRPPEFDVQHVTRVGLNVKTSLEPSMPVELRIDNAGY